MIIYHITWRKDWDNAQSNGLYQTASLESEGFIHASLAHQVAPSANLFFKGQTDLLLLTIETEKLQSVLKFENTTGGEELFPHIYGSLNLDAVTKIEEFKADDLGVFHFS
jgi:uncharacterized protein (DUF952 family)